MKDCWMAEPGMRPSFSELAEKIGEELSEGNKQVGWLGSVQVFYHSLFQHYLQLSCIKSPQDILQSSNSDSTVCLTLPRNFRLRTEDSEGEEEDGENTPMLQPRARQAATTSENYEKRRLFRQHTISNPGYQMLMKKLKTSKIKSSETEIPELLPRPLSSLKSSECPESP